MFRCFFEFLYIFVLFKLILDEYVGVSEGNSRFDFFLVVLDFFVYVYLFLVIGIYYGFIYYDFFYFFCLI